MEPVTATQFTPLASLAGGILIGLSATIVMLLFGRIAGIAGITNGAAGALVRIRGGRRDWPWRVAFVAGLICAPFATAAITGDLPSQTVPSSLKGMAAAGLLVGIGTGLGSGCTSGHGVCGLARLSMRSLIAVVVFVATAILTVFLLRHGIAAGAEA